MQDTSFKIQGRPPAPTELPSLQIQNHSSCILDLASCIRAGGGGSEPRGTFPLGTLTAGAGAALLLRSVLLHPAFDFLDLLPLLVGQDQTYLEQHLETLVFELLTSGLKDGVGGAHRCRVEFPLVDRAREIEPGLVDICLEVNHAPRTLEDHLSDLALLLLGEPNPAHDSLILPPPAWRQIEIVRRQRARHREESKDDH